MHTTSQKSGASGENHPQSGPLTSHSTGGLLGRLALVVLLSGALSNTLDLNGRYEQSPQTTPPPSRVQAVLGKLPLYFIENRGQVDERVAYYVQGRDTSLYFTSLGVTFVLSQPQSPHPAPLCGGERERGDSSTPTRSPFDTLRANGTDIETGGAFPFMLSPAKHDRHGAGSQSARPVSLRAESPPTDTPQRWVLKLDFVGATPNVQPRGQDLTAAVVSYFKGSREQWQSGLPTYARVVYADLWPGVDLVYSGTGTHLKYTFVIKPGANPQQIKLAYRGATTVTLTDGGQLQVATPVGGFTDDTPYAYQEAEGRQVKVTAAYSLEADPAADRSVYSFQVGSYDPSKELILDPVVLAYAGYIGGSGSDVGLGIAVDQDGNAYVTGGTGSTESTFPVLVGPDLTSNGFDAFVAKVKADGTGLLYAGYIGGSRSDVGFGIAVDQDGNAYVTGDTNSDESTFPVLVGPDLTFNGHPDDENAFVAKVKADGTALLYAGYIGSSGSSFSPALRWTRRATPMSPAAPAMRTHSRRSWGPT